MPAACRGCSEGLFVASLLPSVSLTSWPLLRTDSEDGLGGCTSSQDMYHGGVCVCVWVCVCVFVCLYLCACLLLSLPCYSTPFYPHPLLLFSLSISLSPPLPLLLPLSLH